jgi:hypothetical protein
MISLPLSPEKKTVWQTILTTINNNFPLSVIKKLKSNMHNKTPTKNNQGKI